MEESTAQHIIHCGRHEKHTPHTWKSNSTRYCNGSAAGVVSKEGQIVGHVGNVEIDPFNQVNCRGEVALSPE